MSKYINIILFSLFGVLSIKLNIGLSLYIPYACYYISKNIKNSLLIIPITIISLYIFSLNNYIIYIMFLIPLVLICYICKNNIKLYIVIYSFIINIITLLIYKYLNNIIFSYIDILSIIITPLLMTFLIYNNYTTKELTKGIKSIAYNEILLAFILSISSSFYEIKNIPLSILISLYFVMYFASSKYISFNIIYSFLISIILKQYFQINYSYILIIVSFIYLIPNILSSISLILLLLFCLYYYPKLIPFELYYMIGIIVILFEIIRLVSESSINNTKIIFNTYENTISQIDNELESFSLFLDKVLRNIEKDDYNEDLGLQITKLANNVCMKCENKNSCYKSNKGKLYYHFKNIINGVNDEFICSKKDDMKRYSRMLSYNAINKNAYTNDLLKPILSGVSNILKHYTIDHNIDLELEFDILFKVKDALIKYGYSISLFNIIKTFKNDFLIEIGIIGICYNNEKQNLENIISKYINCECSVNLKEIKGNKIYVTVIPKTSCEVCYGYGAISKIGNNICGDNYLVKQLSNRKLIAIICDGMGKGLNANIISNQTLKLIDEITNTNITSETSLQILNTLYYIQDYQDIYTTLDYIEIDRCSNEMTLFKAGAAYTYIIHESGEISKIENESLPFGLNEMMLSKKIKLNNNDLILISSDGVFDNIININEFEKYLINIKDLEPQKIAYEILNYARNTDLISKDDMSIIALKVRFN